MIIDRHLIPTRGTIALMGSGEFTATMVSVHKQLLQAMPDSPRAVFLDTPAGFQLNADEISRKAQGYFEQKIQHSLQVVSFKQPQTCNALDTEQAYARLRSAQYILLGPGSPSYTVHQLAKTAVPDIFYQHVVGGGCLTAASAAALTVGRKTLPVYEIYKVGQAPHWIPGLDILGRCGIRLAVVPHWNNAEGGTHDTRFCFMGQPRLLQLEKMLGPQTPILGIDEHTVCIFDFEKQTIRIRGLGEVVLRAFDHQTTFKKGRDYPLSVLDAQANAKSGSATALKKTPRPDEVPEEGFWDQVHQLKSRFEKGQATRDEHLMTRAILELDRTLWQAQQDMEDESRIVQGRDLLRELMVLWGLDRAEQPDLQSKWQSLVDQLVALRQQFREQQAWSSADLVREALQKEGVLIEDTPAGSRWKRVSPESQP